MSYNEHLDEIVLPDYISDNHESESDTHAHSDGEPFDIESDDDPVDLLVNEDNVESTVVECGVSRRVTGGTGYQNISFLDSDYDDISLDSFGVVNRDSYYEKDEGVLRKGMIFRDKRHVMWAVKDYSVRLTKCAYRVHTSNPTVWQVLCITTPLGENTSSVHSRQCGWRLRAIFRPRKGVWQITKYGSAHSCLLPTDRSDHPNLCKNLVAMLITSHVEADPVFSGQHVQLAVKQEYDYNIPYHKAWQGLKRARENVYGTWESSVRALPKFMQALQTYNPGTVVEWKHKHSELPGGGAEMLGFVFWAFRPCIEAFRHCRKLISVDGTFLVAKYKHTMLIASTIDANQHVLPLAYAVVDSENYRSWHWFLHMVSRHVVRDIPGVCLLSDRHPALLKAVERVQGFAVNCFCLRHISSNFNKHFKNVQLKDLCYKAGAEPRVAIFNKIMEQIKVLSPEAFTYLDEIDKHRWTLSHDGGARCGIMTTNMSECINGVLLKARRLPITTLVRITFNRAVRLYCKRYLEGQEAQQMGWHWPGNIHVAFIRRQRKATRFTVHVHDWPSEAALVVVPAHATGAGRSQTYRVSLSERACSCGTWLSSGMPCTHVIAACIEFRRDVREFFQPYYRIDALLRTYTSGSFQPLPDLDDWSEAHFELVHDPHTRRERTVGRVAGARIHNEMDQSHIRLRQRYRAQETASTSQPGGPSRH